MLVSAAYRKFMPMAMEKEMIDLHQSIKSLQKDREQGVIQFIGSHKGEGTSSVAREYAATLAAHFGKSVLLLDGDETEATQQTFFQLKGSYSLEEAINTDADTTGALHRIADSTLYTGKMFNTAATVPHFFNTHAMDDLLAQLRTKYDFIIIDSAPAAVSSSGMAFTEKVDGIVLVFEAENTRWPVIKNIKQRISKNGGNILGIVFNKRKLHIPRFLYNHL